MDRGEKNFDEMEKEWYNERTKGPDAAMEDVMRILVYSFRDFDEKEYFDALCEKEGFTYATCTDYPSVENAYLAKGCDAISIIVTDMNEALLTALREQGVRYILTRSIGTEHIDMKAARRLGLRVASAVYSPDSVANYAIMLMLMCCRKFPYVLDRAKIQDYSLPGKRGRELSAMTVGVIGTGRSGRTVLSHLSGFGCRLLGYDAYPNKEAEALCEMVDLETIYRECDVISLHCPATKEIHHMIDAGAIAKMKPGVILINTARGGLIDTMALIDGLESGHIGAAGLDVIENEYGLYYINHTGKAMKNRELALLSSFPNVIVAPHAAFYTDVSVYDMVRCTVEACAAFERGEPYPYEVK